MNDDELVERLRSSLHDRAETLHPSPGRLPRPGESAAAAAAERAVWGPSPSGPSGQDEPTVIMAAAEDPAGPTTDEYALLAPTGPIPILSGGRRRWIIGGAAALVAAAAIAIAVVLQSGSHPVSVPPATLPTAVPVPNTTAPAPTTATAPPTTAAASPAIQSVVVPAGFQPASVTFVSAYDGWVVGWVPCAAGECASLAHTIDSGTTWTSTGAPELVRGATSSTGGPGPINVRFANAYVGWIWAGTDLYRSDDGGTTWRQEANPFPGASIGDIEVSGGSAQLVAYGTCTSGSPGCQDQTIEELFTSPINSTKWSQSSTQFDVGAGPVWSPALTLWGADGWLVNVDRTTGSGARLVDGNWEQWTPPCSTANGGAVLGAASADNLVAICGEGEWGAPDPGTKAGTDWLFASINGGSSFNAVAEVPGTYATSVTAAPGHPDTIAMTDNADGLLVSFNGGTTWQTALTTTGEFDFVGFTTASQAVALTESTSAAGVASVMYMTRDGGHTWQKVTF